MNREELDYIIQEGESYLVEFKERVNASLAREITAFANASGGRIFVGITDKGAITGVAVSNKIRSQIQDIANVYMGTGMNKIRRLLQEAKCAGPRFDFGSFFTIVFPRAEKMVGAGLKPGATTQETDSTTQETTQETGLTTEETILRLLREDPSITQRGMASRVGLTPDGIKFHINRLKEKGYIRHEGPTKKGRWVIKD
jgi:predicted HTH transcriptional regulator